MYRVELKDYFFADQAHLLEKMFLMYRVELKVGEVLQRK